MPPRAHPPSEADKESHHSPSLMDRLQPALAGKYFSKNPEDIAALRAKQMKLKEK